MHMHGLVGKIQPTCQNLLQFLAISSQEGAGNGGRCKAHKTLQYIELMHTEIKLLVAHPPAISEVRPKLLTIIFQALKL